MNIKNLIEYQKPTRYMEGSVITLENIRSLLQDKFDSYQIPVEFEDEKLTGALTNDCLVLCHPNHKKDYFKWVFYIARQGTMAVVYVTTTGTSKNSKSLNLRGDAGAALKSNWITAMDMAKNGSPVGMKIVSGGVAALAKGLLSLGGSKAKAQEEEMWYGAVAGIISEVIC